ncbi:MAG: Chondroitin synthase [Gammaproteobacteria bacterium]|nr:Chondroitin synthase [Gammaproteobacteria bacterium]
MALVSSQRALIFTGRRGNETVRVENQAISGNMARDKLKESVMETGKPEAEKQLKRLRRRNNLLVRQLQEIRDSLGVELHRNIENLEAVRREVSAMKQSRVWRTAIRLKKLDPRRFLNTFRLRGRPGVGVSPAGPEMDCRALQYQSYLAAHALTGEKRRQLRERMCGLAGTPLISIVMPVYNAAPQALKSAVESVSRQIYECWELCLVDDASDSPETVEEIQSIDHPRVKTQTLRRHGDIAAATNAAIAMSSGEYIAFMDHDDELAPDALVEAVSIINDSDADFIYTDEDCLDEKGNRVKPHFKPDFSPDLLLSHNYITHLVVARRDLVERIGGLRSGFDGAQDYDFVLRATELAGTIRHIPKVLYHWRMSETSTSRVAASKPQAMERGRLAIKEAMAGRGGEEVEITHANVPYFYRTKYRIKGRPLVSILIPFKDKPELLHCIVGDIVEKSTYDNFEIVGISNNSTDPAVFEAMDDLSGMDDRVTFAEHNIPFSFSALVNYGARLCSGRHLVLLNNDIRISSPDWIEALLEHSQRADVGAVGGKLYYPDDRVQHAGVVVGIGGYAGHSHKGFPGRHQGYFNRLQVVQNVSAVTGAFMMVKLDLYRRVGGFDETQFPVACNDVDFCLRLRESGLWNVFTPYAQAYHIESASRGYEDTPDKEERFAGERKRFTERHGWIMENGDPFYNPNLSHTRQDFSLRVSAEC